MSALFALAGRALADDEANTTGDAADTTSYDDELEDLVGDLDDLDADLDDLDPDDVDVDDAELARSPIDVGAVLAADSPTVASGLVGDMSSIDELEARQRRPSKWGRLDLAIAWRRVEREDEPRREELWLVATWRH